MTASETDIYRQPHSGSLPRAVYIHVPFCRHRCGYCDFTLVARRDELIPRYLQALSNELSTLSSVYDVETIYIGGGTPTHLSAVQLTELLQRIGEHFRLTAGGEFTVEANPDGLDDDRLAVLVRHGVNRLSLGVQSFDEKVLQTLEREHSREQAIDVIRRARSFVSNLSVDLIFGVPDQSIGSWEETLKLVADLAPEHVSAYGLTFEKGTTFYGRRHRGQLVPVPDEIERAMYQTAMTLLGASGFEHYEISNFAKPGFESRHNHVYWAADHYFAFGPGAARYLNGVRSTNSRNVRRWIDGWLRHQPVLQEIDVLSDETMAREAVFVGLRRNRGIDLQKFEQRFRRSLKSLAPRVFDQYLKSGMLEVSAGQLRLTDEGRFVADSVFVDFL
ncbi:MAG: radical SAM family heme chaperone HemW [Planctomycetaceae bacterium]|nr:radical SAM family heme chaperone HemW [Planctomycetaceae bacterium]